MDQDNQDLDFQTLQQLGLASQQPSQPVDGPHPLTDKIAQLAMSLHQQQNQPALSRVPVQGGPGFMQRFGSAMLGHPIDPNANSVVATNQLPDQSSLPPGMQLQPIGKDAQGNPLYDYTAVQKQQGYESQLAAALAKMNQTNPVYTTPDQISQASGGRISGKDAQAFLDAFGGRVSKSSLAQALTGQGLDSKDALAQARQAMVTQSSIKTLLQYGGPGAAQKAASDASQRLVNLQRAQALIDQINSSGGQADQRQRTELATALGRSLNPTGVLTNEALNMYLPETAKGKFGNFIEYLTNERQPVNFTGFLPALQDLLSRESDVNNNVFNQARQMGVNALQQLPGVSKKTVENVVTTPAPGIPQATQQPSSQSNPADYSAETNYLKQIGARVTPANLKWARSKLGK